MRVFLVLHLVFVMVFCEPVSYSIKYACGSKKLIDLILFVIDSFVTFACTEYCFRYDSVTNPV
jgi:hypothetical protein